MLKRVLAAMIAATTIFAVVACQSESEPNESDSIKETPTVTTQTEPEAPKDNTTVDEPAIPNEDEEVVVVGSGETTDDDSNTTTDVVKDDSYYFSDLSNERFDNYNFRILVRKGQTDTQYFDEPQSDIVDNAIYQRNMAVEEKYGVHITIHETSDNNYETDALNSILAGDDAYDIIFTHSRAAFTYAVQGACYNLNNVKSLNLEKPWWSQDIVDSCNINGKLYVLDGDISTTSLENAMCMYFNKRIFDDLGYDYPYELVADDEWTFDEFAYYAKKGGADLNGDGVITREIDQYGFGANGAWHAPVNIIYTGGQKIYDKTDDGLLELSLYSNKTVEIFDEYFSLINNESCSGDVGISQFSEGRVMISAGSLGDSKTLRSMDDEFGIIPYPKFTEDDKYATVTNGGSPLMIIPVTVSDVERTGAITEALCAYGSKLVLPAFYETSLKTKYARDDDSEAMIDIVKNSIIFDVGYLSGGSLQNTGYDLARASSPDFASYYAARKDAAQTKLETFLEDYGGVKN